MARILVVDDDPDILKLAEQILFSCGHSVFLAEDALRGIEWLNKIDFDLLISDATMPHYTGFDLISTVRNNSKYSEMSIAMLTGLRDRKDVERAVKIGVDDYIVKPLDPVLFINKVNALFEKRAPRKYPNIHLSPLQGKATMQHEITLESISELGVTIVTEEALKTGQTLRVAADFFNSLQIEVPLFKVMHVEQDSQTRLHRSQLIYLGAHEAMLQKIRRWLYSHGASYNKTTEKYVG